MTAQDDDTSHMLMTIPPFTLSPSNAGGKVQQNISILIETTHMRDDIDPVRY